MSQPAISRQVRVGAELIGDGVHFRVWAPARTRVRAILHRSGEVVLAPEEDGYFSAHVPDVRAGDRYHFELDEDPGRYPDPASRFQPEGPHGPSEVVDPDAFDWSDASWQGITLPGQVLYELHVGTFTPEGTYRAAADRLPLLRDVGVTTIELMPVAEFPGRFGWGYDGVDLFAPTHLYGRPDDLRALVDRAHALGLGVLLDVVYNHLGPDGNYLRAFAPSYFTDRYKTEWGEAINFDGAGSAEVRSLYVANAAYWIREFHFDGLRLDATQSIHDASPTHILADVGVAVRRAAGRRHVILVAENEPQHTELVRPLEAGGYGLDALWNDDLHHTVVVAATGRTEAYYTDYLGSPQELVSAAKWGYLFQGQRYAWQTQHRGTAGLDLPPSAFVAFLENHDQVANTARGCRLHQLTSPGRLRALTALILLMPATPMLFQGQEWGSTRPFLYFADHEPGLAGLVRKGRGEFLEQFESIADPAMQAMLADPADEATYRRSVLDWAERDAHAPMVRLHRDLLTLRREHRAFSRQLARGVDGAVLGPEAFVLRFFDGAPGARADLERDAAAGDRLLLVNLGRDVPLLVVPEPLLGPPPAGRWQLFWSSEDPSYGGGGTPAVHTPEGRWTLPGHAAFVMKAIAGAPERGAHSRRTA